MILREYTHRKHIEHTRFTILGNAAKGTQLQNQFAPMPLEHQPMPESRCTEKGDIKSAIAKLGHKRELGQ